MLALLEDAGALVKSHAPNAVEDELRRFDDYMEHARGLAKNTRVQRLHILRPFLQRNCGSNPHELTSLTSDDLRRFIALQLQRWSPASANVLASALRSYIRFRAVCGDQVVHLLPAITSPANWRLAPLPQTLSPIQVTKLLDSFFPDLPSALRACAMVRCVVDLGLRASEVVSLGLDDIDWLAGTLRIVKNKSRRVDVLPLPQPTGKAIANYLRSERPHTANRRVFVRHVAPVDEPIGPGVVRRAVREAYLRCGLPHSRVHILRHTLASRLLDTGATLKEVADVLRHRELDTSLIYAKVDTARLSAVALPWPGSAS
jgi:site-specific recombinase XerD